MPDVLLHPADPGVTYKALLDVSPTINANQLLLTVTKGRTQKVVTTFILSKALEVLLEALHLDSAMYSLRSLHGWNGPTPYHAPRHVGQ